MKLQLQVIAIFLCYTLCFTNCKKVIKMLGFHPFLPTTTNYPGLADIALEEINANETILHNYTLEIEWKETNCNDTVVFEHLIDFIWESFYNDMYYPIVFGLPCLDSIQDNIEGIIIYNMLLFTFSEFIPMISLPTYYPEDYRNYNSSINGFPTRLTAALGQIQFIQNHDWNRVAIVNSDDHFLVELGYQLREALNLLKVENILETLLRISDEEKRNKRIDDAIDTIVKAGYRIILFNAFDDTIYGFYCRLSQRIDHYRKFTFIVQNINPNSWPNSTKCPPDTLQELLNRTFGFLQYPRVKDFVSAIQNKNSRHSNFVSTIDTLHNQYPYNSELWDVMGLYMYDGMWALALALDQTFNEGYTPDGYYYHYELPYSLSRNIRKQQFEGITGKVDFENGLRETH